MGHRCVVGNECGRSATLTSATFLPEDLEHYLASALELGEENVIDSLEYHGAEGAETTVYDFGGGYLRIEVRNGTASNGLEGPLMNITTTRDLPSR